MRAKSSSDEHEYKVQKVIVEHYAGFSKSALTIRDRHNRLVRIILLARFEQELDSYKNESVMQHKGGEPRLVQALDVMRLADGVEMLELSIKSFAGQNIIHPTLTWDDDTVVLVDAGFPGQLQQIRESMARAGVSFNRLDKVIITHQDIDHIGGLPDIVRESSHNVDVLSHVKERAYIEGRKPLIKMNQENLSKRLASLPEEQRQQAEALFANPPKASVSTVVADGEVLPYCGGITVIFTPGHTPGHICLYLNQSKILVSGDALVIADGELRGPNPRATYDMDTAFKSLKKLTRYNVETVVCYHGGFYRDDPNKRLAELASAAD